MGASHPLVHPTYSDLAGSALEFAQEQKMIASGEENKNDGVDSDLSFEDS